MLIVMQNTATENQINKVCEFIESLGFDAHKMPGAQRTAVCVTGNDGAIEENNFAGLEAIREIIRVSKPYKLASNETKPEPTVIRIGDAKIGAGNFAMIAGPCSVEDESTMLRVANKLSNQGIKLFRGGAFKPRTSPYGFQGQGEKGLQILAKIRKETGMHVVTEVMNPADVDLVAEYADVLQVGTRNMQNFALLKKLGKINKPVILKRGMSATLDEFLLASEYILVGGNKNVILCERGIRTFANHSRNTLDVTVVPALQAKTHLPIIIDPSHAAGASYMVPALCRCATALGVDGLIVESHDEPNNAWTDGAQAITPDNIKQLLSDINHIRKIVK